MTAEFEVCGCVWGGIHSCNAHTRMTALLEQALKVDLSLARSALAKVIQTPHSKNERERDKKRKPIHFKKKRERKREGL
jgi:hypothetical protein